MGARGICFEVPPITTTEELAPTTFSPFFAVKCGNELQGRLGFV